MKVVNLLRHAKSSSADPHCEDIERPLNERGHQACVAMAPELLSAGCDLRYVVCSPAIRAQETITGIKNAMPSEQPNLEWQTIESLYTFDWRCLLESIQSLDKNQDEVLVVGHNPAITELCNTLTDGQIDNVPTCAYARIEFDETSWAAIGATEGRLTAFARP